MSRPGPGPVASLRPRRSERLNVGGTRLEERLVFLAAVARAPEVFLTGTSAEVMPVTSIDRRAVGDGRSGPIARRLLDGFRRLV